MQAELLNGADLPAGCWLMGNDRRGFMAALEYLLMDKKDNE